MTKTLDSTPKKDGFRMPGEFEPHKVFTSFGQNVQITGAMVVSQPKRPL